MKEECPVCSKLLELKRLYKEEYYLECPKCLFIEELP